MHFYQSKMHLFRLNIKMCRSIMIPYNLANYKRICREDISAFYDRFRRHAGVYVFKIDFCAFYNIIIWKVGGAFMSAFGLRIIACISMLIDHIGYSYGITFFRIIGRLAFPIFLFLIYNGYKHTSSKIRYALRLGLFALLSQVPFSLFCSNQWLIVKGNVFVTLLICLLCFWLADLLRRDRIGKYICLVPWILAFAVYFFGYFHSDYGPKAVLMGASLFLFYGKNLWKRLMLIVCFAGSLFYSYAISLAVAFKNYLLGASLALAIPGQWEWIQLFSLFAFVFIFAYNGKKGGIRGTKTAQKRMQYGFYLFYPAHMLILWLIRVVSAWL